MMQLIINENKLLEDCIEQKKLLNNITLNYFINLLIRKNKNMNNKQLAKYILDIVLSMDLEESSDNQEYKLFEKIKRNISKERNFDNKIRDIDYIPLYEKELELIRGLKTDREKKFIFTCIIVARLFNKDGWFNIPFKDLFKLANMSMKSEDMNKFIFGMKEKELIYEPISNKNSSLHIDFFEEGEEVIKVYEMKNLGNQILAKLKPNYKQCVNCGKMIKIKGNKGRPQKYCEDCAYKIDKQKAKERMRIINGKL